MPYIILFITDLLKILCIKIAPGAQWANLGGQVGVGDIIEKNYRQPIYRNFSNYRQIIDIEFWEFGNYRKIIDIENCIQFYPINTIESIVLKQERDHDDQQKSCCEKHNF